MNFQAMNRQRKFILLAAAAGVIAMFLPWITVSAGNPFESLSGGDNGIGSALSVSENGMHGAGIVVFLSFLCGIVLSLLGEQTRALDKTNWLVALSTGAAALLFSVIVLSNNPTGSMGIVKSSIGFGAWIALAASVVILLVAWRYKSPGDTIRGNFDQLKKDWAIPTGPNSNQDKN
jgi:hypothetical protein